MQCPIMSVGEFFKGITAETADQSVEKKPCISSRSECISALYRVYIGDKETFISKDLE